MENKNINPPSGDDTSWLDDLLASSNYGEDAIEDLSSSVEDMELERIIREAKADEWDLTDIIESQQPDYEEPVPAPQPALEDPEVAAQVYWEEDEEAAPLEETEEEIFEESDRKVRPKRKSSYGLFGLPHFASILIWIGIVAVCGISLGRLLWICATDVLAFGREDRVTTITITNSDVGNIDAIADKLYNAGLSKYKQLFRFYAS